MDSYREEASEWFGNSDAASEYSVGKSWHPDTLAVDVKEVLIFLRAALSPPPQTGSYSSVAMLRLPRSLPIDYDHLAHQSGQNFAWTNFDEGSCAKLDQFLHAAQPLHRYGHLPPQSEISIAEYRRAG